jgi:hypothetical protein
MDPSGNANAQVIHQWNEKIRTRLLAQVKQMMEFCCSIDRNV